MAGLCERRMGVGLLLRGLSRVHRLRCVGGSPPKPYRPLGMPSSIPPPQQPPPQPSFQPTLPVLPPCLR